MNLIPAILAFVGGGILALQVVVNSQARVRLRVDGENLYALQAALINFGGGTIVLIAICALCRFPLPSALSMRVAPWWIWTGGLLGIVYVASSTVLGHVLGIAFFMTLVIAGQVVSSLVFDHYGFGGIPIKPINAGRLLGTALVLIGVIIVARSTDVAQGPPAQEQAEEP